MARPVLSLVLPIYNEEEVIPELHQQLQDFLAKLGLETEVIFVNDGSKDLSLQMLRGIVAAEPRYKVLSFARNFGHQTAITAGMDYARGQAVVVMDADLQDPPEVVLEMVQKWREGFDVVYGQRARRVGETSFKLLTAKIFYRLFRSMIPIEVPLDTGDFRLMGRRVVVTLRALRESHRFVRGMVSWVGFRQTAVLYDRPGRFAGETKYPLRKMLRFALDGITSFSTLPLRFATYLGLFISFVSVLVALWATIAHFGFNSTVPGWTATVVIVTLLSSVQLVMIGILGEYVGRIYEQVKMRPLYVVAERVNLGDKDDDGIDDLPPPPAIDPRASVPPKLGTIMGMPAPSQLPLQTAPIPVFPPMDLPPIPKTAPIPQQAPSGSHAVAKTQPMSALPKPGTAEVPTAPQPSAEAPTIRDGGENTEVTTLERPVTKSFPPPVPSSAPPAARSSSTPPPASSAPPSVSSKSTKAAKTAPPPLPKKRTERD